MLSAARTARRAELRRRLRPVSEFQAQRLLESGESLLWSGHPLGSGVPAAPLYVLTDKRAMIEELRFPTRALRSVPLDSISFLMVEVQADGSGTIRFTSKDSSWTEVHRTLFRAIEDVEGVYEILSGALEALGRDLEEELEVP